MIRHNILFKIKPTIMDDEIHSAFQLLFDLKKVLPGFVRVAAGKCHFHENYPAQVDGLYGFSIDFENEDAYSNFLNNPVTNPAKEAMLKMIVDGYDGLYGFDVGRVIES
jgi:hypothetical protein